LTAFGLSRFVTVCDTVAGVGRCRVSPVTAAWQGTCIGRKGGRACCPR